MAEPEIKTMKKDIEEMKKKIRTSASLDEPIAKRGETVPVKSVSSIPLPPKQATEPPLDLPVASSLPGASLPSEPIFSRDTPLATEIPLKQSEQVATRELSQSEIKKPPYRRKIFILIIIIILLSGAGFYYLKYIKGPEKPGVETPASLFQTESTEVISIKEGKESALSNQLKKKIERFQEEDLPTGEAGTFRRILVKKISKEKDYFLSFKEFIEILGINLPINILENLGDSYTFFLYSQKEGVRSGLVIGAENIDNLKISLRNWEELLSWDLKPMFFGAETGGLITENFQDGIYKGVNIRYLNFSDFSFAIDYAVVRNYLIIATSKESMRGVIDRIIQNK